MLTGPTELHITAHHRVIVRIPDGVSILAPDVLRVFVVEILVHLHHLLIRLKLFHGKGLSRLRVCPRALGNIGTVGCFLAVNLKHHRARDGAVALVFLQIVPAILRRGANH